MKYDIDAFTYHAVARDFNIEIDHLRFNYGTMLVHLLNDVAKEYKRELFASKGFVHQYSFRCMAPTLLLDQAYQLDATLKGSIPTLESAVAHIASMHPMVYDVYSNKANYHSEILETIWISSKIKPADRAFINRSFLTAFAAVVNTKSGKEYSSQLTADVKRVWQVLGISHSRVDRMKMYLKTEMKIKSYFISYLKLDDKNRMNHLPAFIDRDCVYTKDSVDLSVIEAIEQNHPSLVIDYEVVSPKDIPPDREYYNREIAYCNSMEKYNALAAMIAELPPEAFIDPYYHMKR